MKPHGGNVWRLAAELGVAVDSIIDLSTCVADHYPPEVDEVMREANLIAKLPEPYSASFSTLYSQYKGIPADNVLLTAGTTEAISALCELFSGEICNITPPTYSDYEHYAVLAAMKIYKIISENTSIAFICNPNNPTGELRSNEEIIELAATYPSCVFVVDESYMPFVDGQESILKYGVINNIVVLRSYSKVFGVPGLRIGYVVASEPIIAAIRARLSPWSVGTMAQKIAEVFVKMNETPIGGLKLEERKSFFKALSNIDGVKPLPSRTQFCLCMLSGVTSSDFAQRYRKRGILIRDCSNISRLGSSYVRISMRDGWEKLF
ncbi:MAG: aminotransferase class I/II-fold pyridoxal phosphate-dependent enzyme [Deferribacteraceae bacterium]|jgi:threonine-phosphate decarboxylase|nr:aminotransferase class I/II-fold pyridoxal phosphate-dependent enzyme [Deferribacteraceae bacterium]